MELLPALLLQLVAGILDLFAGVLRRVLFGQGGPIAIAGGLVFIAGTMTNGFVPSTPAPATSSGRLASNPRATPHR
jgi:hypothetical protein